MTNDEVVAALATTHDVSRLIVVSYRRQTDPVTQCDTFMPRWCHITSCSSTLTLR